MIAPSVPHLLLQHDLGTSPIAFRLVFIALACNRVSKKQPGVGSFPSLVALPPTVEMPALQNEINSSNSWSQLPTLEQQHRQQKGLAPLLPSNLQSVMTPEAFILLLAELSGYLLLLHPLRYVLGSVLP
jgi:hypothetical protein